jgi:hypothetical protein
MYASYVVYMVLAAAGFNWIGMAFYVAAFLAGFAWGVNTGYFRLAGAPDRKLDQAELHLRNHSFRRAFLIYAGVHCGALAYAKLAANFGWRLPTMQTGSAISLLEASLLLALTLPSALLAWNDNPPVEE